MALRTIRGSAMMACVCVLLSTGGLLAAAENPPLALANDNRSPGGRTVDGALTLDLVAGPAMWRPEADDGPGVLVHAFAERGGRPVTPGPLIRVREGTRVRVSVRNDLPDTLYVHGLEDRPAGDLPRVLRIAPGEAETAAFVAGAPGTYYYWASTRPLTEHTGLGRDSQLSGALVVDPREGPVADDRILLMSIFGERADGTGERVVMVFNGRSFPHTERLEYAEGDTISWRVINATRRFHPMHLHGFYYFVESRGDARRETRYAGPERPEVVTETLRPGGTMAMRFVAKEPGFWAFHCHFAFHSGGHLGLAPAEHYGEPSHGPHGMAGLVMVFFVKPDPARAERPQPAPRQLRILVRESADTSLAGHRMAFQLHDPRSAPPPDTFSTPSSPLVLTRGERVAITIVNRLREPTQIHWHGLEIESYPDGIPGITGMPGRRTPQIEPADSFTAVFTPPRTGTFIYHAHMNDGYQINLGLYAPLLVLDPGAEWDRRRDHVVLVGGGGRLSDRLVPGLVNGEFYPAPIRMRVGETHRLRLISIHPEEELEYVLMGPDRVAEWLPVAKDGADLPPVQRRRGPAYLLTAPGEAADFEFTPERPGGYRLVVKTLFSGWHVLQPIVVRP